MKNARLLRVAMMVCSGALLLQAAGCNFLTLLEMAQTGLLGVTAAGAIAILQNI